MLINNPHHGNTAGQCIQEQEDNANTRSLTLLNTIRSRDVEVSRFLKIGQGLLGRNEAPILRVAYSDERGDIFVVSIRTTLCSSKLPTGLHDFQEPPRHRKFSCDKQIVIDQAQKYLWTRC